MSASFSTHAETFNVNDLNFGFTNYLGSGIYKVAGRTVQVYQVPFSFDMDNLEIDKWELTLTLPVTVGFYDFKLGDVIDIEFPDSLSTLSIMPGIKALYPVNKNWTIGPFLDIGFVNNFETNDVSEIFGTGVLSYYVQPYKQTVITLSNRLLYAKDSGLGAEQEGEFASFETGVDVEIQHEVGITFGMNHIVNLKYLQIPRLGLGYRFGDHLSIFRFVIGTAF